MLDSESTVLSLPAPSVFYRFQKGTFCKCHLETPSKVFDTSHSAYRPWDEYLKFQKFLKIGPSPIHNNSLLQCYLENKCGTSSSNGSLFVWLFSLFFTIGVDNHPPSFPDYASKIPVSLSSPSYFSFTLYSWSPSTMLWSEFKQEANFKHINTNTKT